MNVPLKLAGFAAVLAAVFGLSFAVGNAVGPIGQTDDDHHVPIEHTIDSEVSDDG